MSMKRVVLLGARLPLALAFGSALAVVACGASQGTGRAPTLTGGTAASAARAGAAGASNTASAEGKRTSRPARPAPPRITTPMPGEPRPAALAEARLVKTTCEDVDKLEIEARVKAMREAMKASFRTWHESQPDCWEQYREEERARREEAGLVPRVPQPPIQGLGRSADDFGGAMLSAAGPPSAAPSPTASAARPASPPPSDRKGAAKEAQGPRAAETMSGTNNQVASVDEADIVKTDGRWVYFAANGALRIAEALDPKIVSVTRLPGASVREMFVEGDRAVVYTATGTTNGARCTYAYDCAFGTDGSSTKVVVLDLGDRKAPRIVREIDFSGSLVAARRIGTTIHTVVADGERPVAEFEAWPAGLETCGTMEAEVKKKFAALERENERRIRTRTSRFPTLRENGTEQAMCNEVRETALRDGNLFTSLVSFDMKDDKAAPATSSVRTRSGAVFASADALYLAVGHARQAGGRWYSWSTTDEVTELHKFRIGATPKETKYVGSGAVPGHVLSQMSMDEWSGYLRVATTKGKVPDPKVASVVSVLAEGEGGNLVRVGAVDGIAPGEDIRAVRFDDDRGYVVTFKKTDPLFVLDLYQPSAPAVLGELKIPGFSTYMHRIDPDHLLSIGFDANDHGDFAYFDGVLLQLFDVSKPTDPRLVHKEKIGTRGSSSAAATDHLAFNWFADRGLLAVPMTVCAGGGDGRNGNELAFSGLYVYGVDAERGFTKLGGVDHGARGASCGTWWSNATSHVKRSVFLDDLVYSVAGDRAKVQRVSALGTDVADLRLDN